MEKRNDINLVIINPSGQSIQSIEDTFLFQSTICLTINNIAEGFANILKTDVAKYNLLMDGRFAIYNAKNIERSIKTMETGPYYYGLYGMAIGRNYWTPQISINKGVFDKVFINSPFLIRKEAIGKIDFSNINNANVYNALLKQLQSLLGADFCYPGIKLCQNQ